MAIWVIKDGQREGPYEEQDVRELVYEGTYTDAEPAIRDGQVDWTTVGHILGRQPPPHPDFAPPSSPQYPTAVEPAATAAAPVEEIPYTPPAPPPPRRFPLHKPAQVTVVDVQIPFGSMVVLIIKLALAAIPAALILLAISAFFWTIVLGLFATVLHQLAPH